MIVPTPQQQATADTMRRLVALGETPRYWRINALEAVYEGHQYDGRPSFWDTTVPLRERAPVVQARLGKVVVQRLATLVFGERSFPRLRVGAEGYRVRLADSEREALQRLVDDVLTHAHLSRTLRQYLTEGLKTASACAVLSLVEGLPQVDLLPVKWCTPTLDRRGRVVRLVVEYKHPEGDRWYWYRREITEDADAVWPPVEVKDQAKTPDWSKIPPAEVIPLPFCPVVWTRNLPAATTQAVDGEALCEGLEDELEALDLLLSMRHRNALYNGDPQMVRTGVDPENPTPLGPAGAAGSAPPDAGRFSWLNSVLPQGWRSPSGQAAAKKAPGTVWNLPQGADAKLLESTGAGAEILQGALGELRRVILDACGVVLADPATLGSGDLSARALTLMHAPMLDVADNLRVDYGDALVAIVQGLLRLMLQAGSAGVLLTAWDAAAPVLARCLVGEVWLGAPLTLQWGAYFEPSAADVQASLASASAGAGGRPVLSQRTAVRLAARASGVEDVDAELKAIAEDGEPPRAPPLPGTPPGPLPKTESPERTSP